LTGGLSVVTTAISPSRRRSTLALMLPMVLPGLGASFGRLSRRSRAMKGQSGPPTA
jgi:hypothetical protein